MEAELSVKDKEARVRGGQVFLHMLEVEHLPMTGYFDPSIGVKKDERGRHR